MSSVPHLKSPLDDLRSAKPLKKLFYSYEGLAVLGFHQFDEIFDALSPGHDQFDDVVRLPVGIGINVGILSSDAKFFGVSAADSLFNNPIPGILYLETAPGAAGKNYRSVEISRKIDVSGMFSVQRRVCADIENIYTPLSGVIDRLARRILQPKIGL